MSKQLTLSSILALLAMGSFVMLSAAHETPAGGQVADHAVAAEVGYGS